MEAREGPARVVVAGGGIAGLEALLALRDLAGDRAALTLVAPEPDFTYRPMIVEEPFADQPAERRELSPIVEELGAELLPTKLQSVDPASQEVRLGDGSSAKYDALIVCVGARQRPAYNNVTTFQSAGESLRLAGLLAEHLTPQRIAFVVPPDANWPLPIYELALLTEMRARQLGRHDVQIEIFTPEAEPLIVFGTTASHAVAETLRGRGIEFHGGRRVAEEDSWLIVHPGGEPLEVDHVVSLPALEGPSIEGLPADEHGFLPIDDRARVKGVEHVYAAGDGTNFPIKQGGIGTQQADAAAEDIAASLGAPIEPEPFEPVLRGMLITGEESLSLKHSLTGGHGEGTASSDYLWWPPHKVSGRYLAAWLSGESVHVASEPPERGLEVEVALPKEWHQEPMAIDPLEPPRVD